MNSANLSKSILKQCEPVSQILKSLAHPTRLKILCSLMTGEKSVMELTDFCDISQSAMSQFLGRMKSEGLLSARRQHQFIYYSIADEKIVRLMKTLKEIFC